MIARIVCILGSMGLIVSHAAAQSVLDPTLKVQTYLTGLNNPTGVVFLNDMGDALVTQKNDGRVIIFRDRKRVGTALDLPVANDSERGLLSIALSPNFANDNFVYLYHTAAAADGGTPITNKISRYRLVGNSLVEHRKIIDLPASPGPNHSGGKILFDRAGKLYVVIGDLGRNEQTSNFTNSNQISRTAAILRIQPSGKSITTNPFYSAARIGRSDEALNDIFAYGIRNSFGMAIDPVSGDLWDTENGPSQFDEINRVRPGFNSGWQDIMGPISQSGSDVDSLVSFSERAFYSDPKLSWSRPVAPTDLHFLETKRLGKQYQNDLFVGDVNTGSIYHFDLTSTRKSLFLTGPLSDYVVNNDGNLLSETESILFGQGFGITTDILSGPGGLFVLSLDRGKLYRITPNTAGSSAMSFSVMSIPEPILLSPMILLFFSIRREVSRATHQANRRTCRRRF